jgi:hypothetical protein
LSADQTAGDLIALHGDHAYAAARRFMRLARSKGDHAGERRCDFGPDLEDDEIIAAASRAMSAAMEAADDAGLALTELRPTTIAGILALITYIEDFEDRKIGLAHKPDSDRSDRELWPDCKGEDGCGRTFTRRVLSNIRDALDTIAVRS